MATHQPPFAKPPGQGVNGSMLRSALRKSQRFVAQPLFWMIVGTAIVLATLAGPFHTMVELTLPQRAVYWSLVIGAGSLLMVLLNMIARALNASRGMHWLVVTQITSLIGTAPNLALVYALNSLMVAGGETAALWLLLIYVGAPIAMVNVIVNGVLAAGDREAARLAAAAATAAASSAAAGDTRSELPAPPPGPEAPPPLLFERLPGDLGRDLISLRAQDHYVEVATARGRATVLMRLSDAERDLGRLNGMRVHRSWWVNLDHAAALARTPGGGMVLTTSDGQEIPVARGQRAALQAVFDNRPAAAG